MTELSVDVAIVGAGIVGAACAMECANAGLKVALIDAGPVGGGSTAAGMGHLVVLDDSEPQFELSRYSQRLWAEIADRLPASVEYDRCGTIWVAADEAEFEAAHVKHKYYSERGLPVEILDAAQLSAAEPNLRDGWAGGLLVPQDAVIYPPAAAAAFANIARDRGASLQLGRRVVEIRRGGVRLEDNATISAGDVVNAAGTRAPVLSPSLPIRPRKGHLLVTDRYPGFARHQIVELGYLKSAHSSGTESVAFNLQPRRSGQLLIGSSRQYGVEDTRVEPAVLSRMLARAVGAMPRLSALSAIRAWTGHRPATPDKLPLIGRLPESPQVWVAAGHEGLGITMSLGTARLLADMMTGKIPEILPRPYDPSRAELAHA